MSDRFHVKFSHATAAALEAAAEEMGTTKVGVLSDGVRIVRKALVAARAGGQLAIVSPTGAVSPLIGPWNDLEPAVET